MRKSEKKMFHHTQNKKEKTKQKQNNNNKTCPCYNEYSLSKLHSNNVAYFEVVEGNFKVTSFWSTLRDTFEQHVNCIQRVINWLILRMILCFEP